MEKSNCGSGKVEQIEIDPSQEQQRIDNFLIKYLKGVPKSRIYRMIRKGEVRVNRRRVRAEYRIQALDILRIPPVRRSKPKIKPFVKEENKIHLEQRILFEDDGLMIINKPSGIPVHGGSGVNAGLIEMLRVIRPDSKFLELVHRLDRGTSGCLLLAKKRSCLKELHELFRSNQVQKCYTALVCGRWQPKKLLVDAPLKKNIRQSGERLVKVSTNGKLAKTVFRRVQRFKFATMIEAKLLTGRTHQIRVHAAHNGHPIVGDDRYGSRSDNRFFEEEGLKRLFLHASTLKLTHPMSGKPMSIYAPLDQELANLIQRLEYLESK